MSGDTTDAAEEAETTNVVPFRSYSFGYPEGETSGAVGELAKALCAVQAVLEPVAPDCVHGAGYGRYASFTAYWEAARKPLADNGLVVTQINSHRDGYATVITLLIHGESGQWIRGEVSLRLQHEDYQDLVSAISYGKKCGFVAIIGLVDKVEGGGSAPAPKSRPASNIHAEARAITQDQQSTPDQQSSSGPGISDKQIGFINRLGEQYCGKSEWQTSEMKVWAGWASGGTIKILPDLEKRQASRLIEELKARIDAGPASEQPSLPAAQDETPTEVVDDAPKDPIPF